MVKTQGKRRSTPPSRRRYEASHPTVSFRVDLDLYAQLKGLKEKANLSVADVLKVGLERCEPLAGEAYNNGFKSALSEAYESVCDDCEDEITLPGQLASLGPTLQAETTPIVGRAGGVFRSIEHGQHSSGE